MITVAGVTFSVTLLAVSHATSQIGHHLLGAFMRDRGNQLTLGTFIATFLYCLMLLRSVHDGAPGAGGDADPDFVPHIAIGGALLLAVLSVIVLIYFIHHVPQSINVTNVITQVGDDLVASIQSLYPEEIGAGTQHSPKPATRSDRYELCNVLGVDARAGYLRIVDHETLMSTACECDLVIEILKHPGEFALSGEDLLRVWSREPAGEEVESRILNCFTWGPERTPNQDVLLSVQQLLEILGRALSPGVNNQYTAVLSINQLGRGLREMLARAVPESGRADADGNLRVVAEPVSHQQFVDTMSGPMRQYVDGDWIATTHVRNILDRLAVLPALAASRRLLEDTASLFDPPPLPGRERDAGPVDESGSPA